MEVWGEVGDVKDRSREQVVVVPLAKAINNYEKPRKFEPNTNINLVYLNHRILLIHLFLFYRCIFY